MTRLCFLDLETTGFEPSHDSIIEVSFVIREEDGTLIKYDQVFTPDKSALSPHVTSITGIEQAELDAEGKNFTDEVAKIAELIGNSVIVGHNINFDIRFLQGNGIELNGNKYIDTHQLARIILLNEKSYALETLAQKYGFLHTNAHRAMSDVEASAELFDYLIKKIEELPAEFFAQAGEVTNHDWYAWRYFADVVGKEGAERYVSPELVLSKELPLADAKGIEMVLENKTTLTPLTDNHAAAKRYLAMAQELSNKGKKVAIVSPKLDYFGGVPLVPTPWVLIDEDRLKDLPQRHGMMEDDLFCFYLQCVRRQVLGYRGKHYFALYHLQYKLWGQVCQQEIGSAGFVQILQEKNEHNIVALSAEAYMQLRETAIIQERTLLIDEGEQFAEAVLKEGIKTYDLTPLLDDEVTSVKAQFWVRNFVREVVEPALTRPIGFWPEKVLLGPGKYEALAEGLEDMDESAFIWAKHLRSPEEGLVRWAVYHPKNSTLTLHVWHWNDWRQQVEEIKNVPKLVGYRHGLDDSKRFWRVMLGVGEAAVWQPDDLPKMVGIVPAKNPESAKSPTFVPWVGDWVRSEVEQNTDEKNWLVGIFGSQETLKKVTLALEPNLPSKWKMWGERVKGGKGKMLQQVQQWEGGAILGIQRIQSAGLAKLPFGRGFVTKFPFAPPSPLYDALAKRFDQQGQTWWDLWVMPQTAAMLGRQLGQFSNVTQVTLLDGRVNAPWGKKLLRLVQITK